MNTSATLWPSNGGGLQPNVGLPSAATRELPRMGRPSHTGLSVKALGKTEYQRQYSRLHVKRETSRRWWTGLSTKTMSHAQYMAAYRTLCREIREIRG